MEDRAKPACSRPTANAYTTLQRKVQTCREHQASLLHHDAASFNTLINPAHTTAQEKQVVNTADCPDASDSTEPKQGILVCAHAPPSSPSTTPNLAGLRNIPNRDKGGSQES